MGQRRQHDIMAATTREDDSHIDLEVCTSKLFSVPVSCCYPSCLANVIIQLLSTFTCAACLKLDDFSPTNVHSALTVVLLQHICRLLWAGLQRFEPRTCGALLCTSPSFQSRSALLALTIVFDTYCNKKALWPMICLLPSVGCKVDVINRCSYSMS
jgi:hypothetical protein